MLVFFFYRCRQTKPGVDKAVFRNRSILDSRLTALRVKGQEPPLTPVSPKYNPRADELFMDVRDICVSFWGETCLCVDFLRERITEISERCCLCKAATHCKTPGIQPGEGETSQ